MQETVAVPITSVLTVEHVMPVAWETSGFYELALATKAKLPEGLSPTEDQELNAKRTFRNTVIHTLGNLTLLTQPLNSSVSCGPFDDRLHESGELKPGKRSTISGQSLLTLNAYFQTSGLSPWNEKTIGDRGEALFNAALTLWARPD